MTSAPWRGTKVHFVLVKPGQSSSTWGRYLRPAHSILAALVVVTRDGYAGPCSRIEAGSRPPATWRRSSNSVVSGPMLTNVNDFRAVFVGVGGEGGAGGEGGDA